MLDLLHFCGFRKRRANNRIHTKDKWIYQEHITIYCDWLENAQNIIRYDDNNISNLENIYLSISTLCCHAYHIDDITKTTNVKPNISSQSSPSSNQFRFSFRDCKISLPQDQTGSVYIFNVTK